MTTQIESNATGHHQWIPLAKLQPSPLNHRKHFDKAKMDELTANVAVQGVIVPIIARPLNGGDTFEIVAGERRYRAAKAAKLSDIPAIVRELTDAQALELQVIENNQRVDVHPLEEAEGYEALMKCPKSDGTEYTADEIAAKVGKSRSYVYGRLKLTALGPNGRKALYGGFLDASRALLLARIPVVELQDKALLEILHLNKPEDLEPSEDAEEDEDFRPRPMSYRDAAEHIQYEYTLQLKAAPFKISDATLVPGAGPCTTCPKRSGNQPVLFADIESADVCTDPKCFAAKRDAHLQQLAKAAADKGKKVVAPNARGYIRLDETCKGDPNCRKVGDVLGKSKVEVMQMPVADSNGKTSFVEVVKKSEVKDTLSEKVKAAREKAGYGGHNNVDYVLQRKIAEEYRRRLFTHVCAAIPVDAGKPELLILIDILAEENAEIVADLLLPGGKKGAGEDRVKAALPKLEVAGLIRLLLALTLSSETHEWHGDEGLLENVAEKYKVAAKNIKVTVEAELKAAAKDDKKVAGKKKPEETEA